MSRTPKPPTKVGHSDALDRFIRTGRNYAIRPRSYKEPEILRNLKLKEHGDRPGFVMHGKDVVAGTGKVSILGRDLSFEDMALVVRSWMVQDEK